MRNDAINMKVNEGLLAFGAEEEGAVVVIVHKEVFGDQEKKIVGNDAWCRMFP